MTSDSFHCITSHTSPLTCHLCRLGSGQDVLPYWCVYFPLVQSPHRFSHLRVASRQFHLLALCKLSLAIFSRTRAFTLISSGFDQNISSASPRNQLTDARRIELSPTTAPAARTRYARTARPRSSRASYALVSGSSCPALSTDPGNGVTGMVTSSRLSFRIPVVSRADSGYVGVASQARPFRMSKSPLGRMMASIGICWMVLMRFRMSGFLSHVRPTLLTT